MSAEPTLTAEELISELKKSQTGYIAACDLRFFLDGAGYKLDRINQLRVMGILAAAWSGRMGSVLDALPRGGRP